MVSESAPRPRSCNVAPEALLVVGLGVMPRSGLATARPRPREIITMEAFRLLSSGGRLMSRRRPYVTPRVATLISTARAVESMASSKRSRMKAR